MRILIVEDKTAVARSIGKALQGAGFIPEYAEDGEDAWFVGGTEPYSAIVLDIGLPKMDGLSVLRNWRRDGITVPVLLLTAKGSWSERVEGIDAGADDYLVKPFQMEELISRLRALIRRSSGQVQPIIVLGELTIDLRQLRVSENGAPVDLTPLEFRLLSFLLHHRDEVITQEELASNIYYRDQEPGRNAIEATIGRLRKKFSVNVIETRRGFGYSIGSGTR
ncbi:MAG: response regulator transcription factor [Rhodobacteraceae bacterium]|nr:response regulator transcription factor [Paracoccaceae bacterium]